jgi:hypothetical protein
MMFLARNLIPNGAHIKNEGWSTCVNQPSAILTSFQCMKNTLKMII